MKKPLVLAVDLDGTLIKTDLLIEGIARLICQNPLYFFCILCWAAKGKVYLKWKVAKNAPDINCTTLPFSDSFLDWLKAEKTQGRKLVLATASVRPYAEKVAAHLGIFDEIFATDNENLKGATKAKYLTEAFGKGGFDYAGNSKDDIPTWHCAANIVAVNTPASVLKKITPVKIFNCRNNNLRAWLSALRPHQWSKNLLLFVAVLAAHKFGDIATVGASALAFAAFCLLSSATYLINDIIDLPHDRKHPKKHRRPLAAGDINALMAVGLAGLLILASFTVAAFLPFSFLWLLGGYGVVSFCYSMFFKRVIALDITVLSTLFVLRIIGGGQAADIPITSWLLIFSAFTFLGLATLKRYIETSNNDNIAGRAYCSTDAFFLAILGCTASLISVFSLTLYIDSGISRELYVNPRITWLLVPTLLYWNIRIWLLVGRGAVSEDPVLFMVCDKSSWFTGVLMLAITIAAAYPF